MMVRINITVLWHVMLCGLVPDASLFMVSWVG